VKTSAFIAATLVLALLAGAGAVSAYDRSHEQRIAEGVTVGGVDVGGMERDAAAAKIRAALLEPLRRPVVARWHDRRFTLTPARAKVELDAHGSADAALHRSRQGNVFSRTFREVTGEELDANVDVNVTWSRAAVKRVVRRAQRVVDRKATDAELDLSKGQVDPTKSSTGRQLRARTLEKTLTAALLSRSESRTVPVEARTLEPKVSTADLVKKYPAILIINRSAFKLTLYKDLKPSKSYGIAVGQAGLETPAGLYNIQNKAVNPAWHVPNSDWAGSLAGKVIAGDDPSNPIKARWMGIYNGAGIHGTSDAGSIGSAASHGCIRMRIPEVVELYDEVPVGAPVYIS
jgi:lipoprotein-anchoring transpeptidase ErfK/SrfK